MSFIANPNPPLIEKTLTGYSLNWKEGILIHVSRLRYKDDALKGEIEVKISNNGDERHIHQANFNFSSTMSMDKLVQKLESIASIADWNKIIEQARVKILQLYRSSGQKIEELDENVTSLEVDYLYYPFIIKDLINLIFGDGGTGKTIFAIYIAVELIKKNYKVLYLDYESSKEIIHRRYIRVAHDVQKKGFFYRKSTMRIQDDIENIKTAIDACKADFIIIDSVGIACGGNLKEPDIVNNFFSTLHQLERTILILHHTSKLLEAEKTPFGSAYFWNNARNVWEIIKNKDEDEHIIGLFNKKCNVSNLSPPLAYKINYFPDKIFFEPVIVEDFFLNNLRPKEKVVAFLKTIEKPVTAAEIAKQLTLKSDTVRQILNRLKKEEIVIKEGEKWLIKDPF